MPTELSNFKLSDRFGVLIKSKINKLGQAKHTISMLYKITLEKCLFSLEEFRRTNSWGIIYQNKLQIPTMNTYCMQKLFAKKTPLNIDPF